MSTWNIDEVERGIEKAFQENSEVQLLNILKNNSFLFYELYSRKYGIQPNFSEISFAGELRCDFAWLNDNSDGPEWVIVEIEKPKMKLFKKNNEPTAELNHAIEQVKSWDRYFKENLGERKRIFGAVSRFKHILVGGTVQDWQTESAIKWRAYHNEESKVEIRSSEIFRRAIDLYKSHFEELWSFEKHPVSLKHSDLRTYWENYGYMDTWRKVF
jgi:hypothetical protein